MRTGMPIVATSKSDAPRIPDPYNSWLTRSTSWNLYSATLYIPRYPSWIATNKARAKYRGIKSAGEGLAGALVIGSRSQILLRIAAETHEVIEQHTCRRIAFRRVFSKAPMYDSFQFLGSHGISLRDRPRLVLQDIGHR